MFRLSFGRPALLLALALLFVAPWEATAAPRLGGAPRRAAFSDSATPDVFSEFLSFVARLWTKNGCRIDPHGQCISGEKEGCGLDPHGQCIPEKAGCLIDPHGLCVSVQVDNGCGIDPHGGCVGGQ